MKMSERWTAYEDRKRHAPQLQRRYEREGRVGIESTESPKIVERICPQCGCLLYLMQSCVWCTNATCTFGRETPVPLRELPKRKSYRV